MSATVALRRVRVRARRRRPPTGRELLMLGMIGGYISQAGWLAGWFVIDGVLIDGILLLLYPLGLRVLYRVLAVQRYWEARGHPQPVEWEDIALLTCLWMVQIVIWTAAAP